MFVDVMLVLPVFLSVVAGAAIDLSPGASLMQSIDARDVAPTLDFTNSAWIWTGEQTGDSDIAPVGVRPFRRKIPSSATKCPVCATIILSCDDSHTLYVNGIEIGSGACYTSSGMHSALYTVGMNPEGDNVVAIAVNNDGGPAGLIAAIIVDYTDGTTENIVTDAAWKTIQTTSPGGWTGPSFDDSTWVAAVSEGPTASTPWGTPPLPPAMDMTGVSWIWTNETNASGNDPLGHRPFRNTITSPYGKAAVCGKVVITADDAYSLYVNGDFIGNGSSWRSMQAYSIPQLDPNVNIIAVDGENRASFNPQVGGVIAGFLIAYNDGTSHAYYTDNTWKTLTSVPPAGFEQTDMDDSAWITPKVYIHSDSATVTVPPA
ncbi:lectin [Desarmillaria tabescens]|uniref:Lectin n=1 Tax=Armillaria tabescens TaxID=1929756 RepID=A0AA39KFE8_ARMTA|nr:lectin [Desarmillaria tabescens]KAK0460105.1 lectin [Desarmillaria tabescens]